MEPHAVQSLSGTVADMYLVRDLNGQHAILCDSPRCLHGWLVHCGDPSVPMIPLEVGPDWCLHCRWCGRAAYTPWPECQFHDTCPETRWVLTIAADGYYRELNLLLRGAPVSDQLERAGERLCGQGLTPAEAARRAVAGHHPG